MTVCNVEVVGGGAGRTVAVAWLDTLDSTSRYHIWIDADSLTMHDTRIYRNSRAAPGQRGHFETRRLNATAQRWRLPILAVLDTVREAGLIAKWDRAQLRRKRDDAAFHALEQRKALARMAAPQLVDALDALVTQCEGGSVSSVTLGLAREALALARGRLATAEADNGAG